MNKRTYEGMMTVSENEITGEKLPETAQLGEADIRRLQDDLPNDEVLYDLAELFRVFGDSTRIKILQKYPHLMAPFSVKGVHFKNHIFLAPCALSHVTYGAPNDLGIEYIEEKARGGVAQITQGNITGPGGYGDNGGHFNRYFTNCFTDMAFTELATAIKEHGAAAALRFGCIHPVLRPAFPAADG